MKWAMHIVKVLLALSFIEAGVVKLLGNAQQIQQFQGFGYPIGFMYFIGACELLGGIGLLAGYLIKNIDTLAAAGLVIIMAGASFSHIHAGEKIGTAAASLILLILCLVVIASNLANKKRKPRFSR